MVGGSVRDMNVVCEWGMQGLRASARGRIVVIVDVLSFSTATTIAVAGGATILPCEWNDERAAALAKSEKAELAAKRGKGRFSLAPASLRDVPRGLRLVLPSPNGSTLAYAARDLDATAIVIGCLRNAAAVASWVENRPVVVIAAGEKWSDGSMRFAIEDWLGAGAIISRLAGSHSYDAEAARTALVTMRGKLRDVLAVSRSGIELIEKGYPDDVDLASELDVDRAVPLLAGNAFTLARS
jgi:2-phosphosulfolactate phosphatase